MNIRELFRNRSRVVLSLLTLLPTCVMAQEQFLECEYLDSIEANWTTGKLERRENGSRQYIGMKFAINRQSGEITAVGNSVALLLFPPFRPEVAKPNLPGSDNFALMWRTKFYTGYEQVTVLNVREGLTSKKGPWQFTHTTSTDWYLSGLCYPTFRP